MTSGFETLSGPGYISSHSADAILSEIRPIKLRLDALRSINVLLDELLYSIISASHSLATPKLKSGIHKILPTTLAKEAVLEAEVELKGYCERSEGEGVSDGGELMEQDALEEDFDLQWSFELLRLRCEGYSTMNDTDEDANAEKRLDERMAGAEGLFPPRASLLAPAALYLTAVLEYMAERILSNIGRVASRDSSRTTAVVQDLFVALCEDEAVYPLFKTMKVYDQIDGLSKSKPRRSGSRSKGSMKSPSRAPSATLAQDFVRDSPSRLSESSSPTASSFERSRTSNLKFFTRSSTDEARSPSEDRQETRNQAKNSSSFEITMDDAAAEFDELVRSETTMKVSLTPDRLKTMEVYKQEKKRHRDRDKAHDNAHETPVAMSRAQSPNQQSLVNNTATRVVEAIREDDGPSVIPTRYNSKPPSSQQNQNQLPTHPTPSPPPSSFTPILPRVRLSSLAAVQGGSPKTNTAQVARTRSHTVSAVKKANSTGTVVQEPSVSSVLLDKKENVNMVSNTPTPPLNSDGRPKRTRKVTRNRESLDLDDVMNGGAEDENDLDTPLPSAKRERDPSQPYVSKSARDLISFLEQGPPEEVMRQRTRNTSMVSLESSKGKASGRLQRMMSKLTLGGSSERLNGKGGEDGSPNGSLRRKGGKAKQGKASTVNVITSPISPPVVLLPPHLRPLNPNVPNVIIGTPPPPPSSLNQKPSLPTLSLPNPVGPSPSASASTTDLHSTGGYSPVNSLSINGLVNDSTSPSVTSTSPKQTLVGRRMSITRKAVPAWDLKERMESLAPPLPPSSAPTTATATANGVVDDEKVAGSIRSITAIAQPALRVTNGYPPRDSEDMMMRPSQQAQVEGNGSIHVETNVLEKTLTTSPTALSPLTGSGVLPSPSSSPTPTRVEKCSPRPEGPEKRRSGKQITSEDARDLRSLLSNATTADECRLLVDMFLTRNGFPTSALATKLAAFPSPPLTPLPVLSATDGLGGLGAMKGGVQESEDKLERSLVALLLGEEATGVA